MATSTSSSMKKATAETQIINSFEALIKTNNIFLFVPNIIGEKEYINGKFKYE